MSASVSLHGATTPFSANTLTDPGGRFRFRKLDAGDYTIVAYAPGRGEVRRTVAVGPSLADRKGRVRIELDLESLPAQGGVAPRATVSVTTLSIPDKAWREYENANRKLGQRDVDAAVAHLEKAVEIAPHFAQAWNHLGTIAYQTRQFPLAEERFREALRHDANAYEPLVNLGGALLALDRLDEAAQVNIHAVLVRPNDALANSQLGMTYFALGKLNLARKYLVEAKRLDPAHFSFPQLALGEIHLRTKDIPAARAEYEEFLRLHPDAPQAEAIRGLVSRLP